MDRSGVARLIIEAINARDFDAVGRDFADNVRFHAPGLGVDVEGRDSAVKHIADFVRQADVQYELEHVVEHGPFVVAFTRSTGTLDQQRMGWDLCQVLRFADEQIAEAWALRGGAPLPLSSG